MMGPPESRKGSGAGAAIGGFLGGPLGSIAGSLIGGLFGSSGQRDANRKNLQIAREQMAFQERMSNTAYSRAAKDLENAGLNRILALGNPASSPGGALATMGNVGAAGMEGMAKGAGTAKNAMEMRILREQENQIRAITGKTHADTATAVEQARKTRAETRRINQVINTLTPGEHLGEALTNFTEPGKGLVQQGVATAKELMQGKRTLYGSKRSAPPKQPKIKSVGKGPTTWDLYMKETQGKDISYGQWLEKRKYK